jgi:hypothetical protein
MSGDSLCGRHKPGNDFPEILFGAHIQIFRAEHTARAHAIAIHVESPLVY